MGRQVRRTEAIVTSTNGDGAVLFSSFEVHEYEPASTIKEKIVYSKGQQKDCLIQLNRRVPFAILGL